MSSKVGDVLDNPGGLLEGGADPQKLTENLSINIGFGSSRSVSESEQQVRQEFGTRLASRNLNINQTNGTGAFTARGLTAEAEQDITINTEGATRIESATTTISQRSQNESDSSSFGVGISLANPSSVANKRGRSRFQALALGHYTGLILL